MLFYSKWIGVRLLRKEEREMRRRGFTLLELVVVILIIGVLATLGIAQYQRMVERARGAEARQIIGAIRSNAAAVFMMNNQDCTNCTNTNIGIGPSADYPGPTAADCRGTHFFWYDAVPDANGLKVTATRCSPGIGKTPQLPAGAVSGTLSLDTDFTTGADDWASSGQY